MCLYHVILAPFKPPSTNALPPCFTINIQKLSKPVIIKSGMHEDVLRELEFLKLVRGSPFICSAYYAFQVR